jgi:hypothetical protein
MSESFTATATPVLRKTRKTVDEQLCAQRPQLEESHDSKPNEMCRLGSREPKSDH